MPTVDLDDKVCRDCGNRGLLVADQFGHCTVCASRNVVPWDKLSPKERKRLQNQ